MQENQDSLGAFLKSKREENNVSIEQVAYATRISLKMLRALEDNDHQALPAPTFVRGYLQAYAKYVHMDTQDLLLRYQHHLATAPGAQKGAIKSHYLYVRERYQEKRRLFLILVLFATMLCVAGAYFFLKHKRERNKELAHQAEQIKKGGEAPAVVPSTTPPAATNSDDAESELTPPATSATPATPAPEAKKEEPVKPTAPAVAAPAATPTATPTPKEADAPKTVAHNDADQATSGPKAYNLSLTASEDAWLRFQMDEEPVKDLTLKGGKTLILRANKVIKIFSGNLGALKAVLNGQETPLSDDKKKKSIVLPSSEVPNYKLPLFPQFQRPAGAATENPDS